MAFRPARALVTGGAGFIGSHLAEVLLEREVEVTVLDNLSTGQRSNVPESARFIEASILDESSVEEALRDCEAVFHLAAQVSVPESMERPVQSITTNATGTLLLLERARRAGVKRFIYSSSSAVYGESPASPKREDLAPEPISPYGVGKLAGEEYVSAYARCYGMQTASLRYFNVFGPRQRHDSPYAAVIPIFLSQMREGKPLTVYGDGEQTRDFTFVADIVQANLKAMESERLDGEVFNIACGRSISLNELIRTLAAVFGQEPEVRYLPPRPGDIKHSSADIRKAQERLGYSPQFTLEEGLRRTIEPIETQ
ncbi:MAG: NDP-sugar dehydratase or epimerase [Fimbriimonadales bacterium]|nr:MAG: NDP-sugar dehydratase or epimerase [Fimbriimonadales bacterium]